MLLDNADMADENDLLKIGADAVVKPFGDLLQKLAGPLAEEVGLAFGDAARVFRYKRALKLLEKVERTANSSGFEPSSVRPKLLLSILDHSSVEDDEGMHDRWAALLSNAANPNSAIQVIPSFAEILSQLSPKEAILLDAIQRHVDANLAKHHSDKPRSSNWAYSVDVGTWKTLLQLYAQLGLSKCSPDVLLNFTQNKTSPETTNDYSNFRVALDDLIRLGVLREDQTNSHPRPLFHITALGYDFVLACRLNESITTQTE